MRMSRLTETGVSRSIVDTFKGYNASLRIGLGEWHNTKNITNDYYPVLSPRARRVYYNFHGDCYGLVEYGGNFYFLTNRNATDEPTMNVYLRNGTGTFIANLTPYGFDKTKKHQIVKMGARVIIFPENIEVNMSDGTVTVNSFSMSNKGHTVKISKVIAHSLLPFTVDETVGAGHTYTSLDEIEYPSEGEYYCVDATSTENWKYYLYQNGVFVPQDVLLKVEFDTAIQAQEGDTVEIAYEYGSEYTGNSNFAVGDSHRSDRSATVKAKVEGIASYTIYVEGTANVNETYTYNIPSAAGMSGLNEFSVVLAPPTIDFVVECENRLWGCRYDGTVNEIYASALGNPRSWYDYSGLADASYAASCGTPGKFTGAVTYNGTPMFFKRDCIHKVYPSASGAHQIVVLNTEGVQEGSHKSIASVNGTLLYRTAHGFAYFDGQDSILLDDVFNKEYFRNAVACAHGSKYYVGMVDVSSKHHLFVYDVQKAMWTRQDDTDAEWMASNGDTLIVFRKDGKAFTEGIPVELASDNEQFYEREHPVDWFAESGVIGYAEVDHKYIGRYALRVAVGFGAEFTVEMEYDSDGHFETVGSIKGIRPTPQTAVFPIMPRRCDHFRIRLKGTGDCKLYSMSFTYEQGGLD